MSLANRSVTSATWQIVANLVSIIVQFVRSILLARWLPVNIFGIYAFALSITQLSVELANFGMPAAFWHRAPETENEEQAAATHFTLNLIFTLAWAIIIIAGTLKFASDQTRTALLLLTVTTCGDQLVRTPRMILVRRVMHRRLAIIQILYNILSTLISLALAWKGVELWALLSTNLINLLVSVVILYVWRPVWRPRLTWAPRTKRYFLRFGSRNFLSSALLQALDRVDDLWVGLYLGELNLGFYSRAYRFATYPRQILARPINTVAIGTYAELKGNRPRLSRAFYEINALLIRSGFLLAGLLALVAPEFIRLALGAKWLPMLDTFRLMLVYTLLDPIKITIAGLLTSTIGTPGRVAQIRLLQLITMMICLFWLGPSWGIVGVALAVDIMLVLGIGILLWQTRAFVDFSLERLFAVPGLALVVGLVLATGASTLPPIVGSDWRTGFVKVIVFSTIYIIILWSRERRRLSDIFSFLISRLRPRPEQSTSGVLLRGEG